MAGVTGLEPATSAVTGQRSNQLSYTPICFISLGWESEDNLSFCVIGVNSYLKKNQISGLSNRRQGGGGGEPR